MAHADFVHLRVHTAYSLSEGAIPVKQLADLCRRHRMPAVGVADTNNLFGCMEACLTLAKAGVQPIIGCQFTLARDGIDDGAAAGWRGVNGSPQGLKDKLVLLVQSERGYRNLLKLHAAAYARQDSTDPHVTWAEIAAHAGGLIALTGGPDGPVGRHLAAGQMDAAADALGQLAEIFADRLYVELMRHGLDIEVRIEPGLIELAERFSLPLVASNEPFFATTEMYEAHDALICIAQGAHVDDTNRRRLTPEHAFKSGAEMRALFSDLPDAADNTVLIARRCAFMIEPVKPMLPPFDGGSGENEEAALRREARTGLENRLAIRRRVTPAPNDDNQHGERFYRERLEYELDVICQMGFAGYFLIVSEFIRWAKERDIPVGPGRGSGAGSLVAWSLLITDLDPIRFGLLFERFLNPERVSMPDFDIDFCQDRRDEVIRHVQEKYGADKVAQIITFGKLQARAVLRDVGRVLGMAYGHVDKICKLVPNNPAKPVTLAQAIESEPQLRQMIDADETVARLVGISLKLEGLYRHASTHAAGVVIGVQPLENLIPLYRDPRSSMPVTGFNMKWVELAGLVKFDFLGLKTLTVLAEAVKLIRAGRGIDVDLSTLPFDDKPTFELLSRGDTVGVFQLESAGMRDALRKLKPDTLEDIIAVVALYRPGPMDNIPSFIRRKHGEEQPDYLYPTLEPILSETYGIMIYQEQVMQIAQELSGYSLGAADILRRAMGKKIKEEMDKQRQHFIEGAMARGVPEGRASHIFELVNKFAGYGFNKSHAAAYALVAYQTAYIKANYPVEFIAASMSLDIHSADKLNTFHRELDRLGIPLLPPDVNRSGVAFTVEREKKTGDGAIRYALAAIKNVGEAAMAALVAERDAHGPFADIADLVTRVDVRHLNKRLMESLARAGAFDSLVANRRQMFEAAETILRHAAVAADERASGQMGLFGKGDGSGLSGLRLPSVADWPPMERLREEFEAIGFYLSAHPLAAYETALKRLRVVGYADVIAAGRSGSVALAGTIIAKREKTSAKGSRYAFVQLSDTTGVFELAVFSELLAARRELIEVGTSVFVEANIQIDGDGQGVRVTANGIEPLDAVASRLAPNITIAVDTGDPLNAIHRALEAAGRGRGRVTLRSWLDGGIEVEVGLPGGYAVGPGMTVALKTIPGVRDVQEV